jgi:hypothetical protein
MKNGVRSALTLFLWSHTLESLIGGQLDAGFILTGFLEGRRSDERAPHQSLRWHVFFNSREKEWFRQAVRRLTMAMQLTPKSVTPFACAKAAPLSVADDRRR